MGSPVVLAVSGATNAGLSGRVSRVNATVDPATRQVKVYVTVPNADHRFVGGLFASGRIVLREVKGAVAVPQSAIRRDEGSKVYVLVVDGGRIGRREITTGATDEQASLVEVTRGSRAEKRSIVGPAEGLEPGQARDRDRRGGLSHVPERSVDQAPGVRHHDDAGAGGAGAVLVPPADRSTSVPNVEFPFLVVQTRYPGASPESVERDVTKKIEEAVNTVEGVKDIQSTSTEGFSTIFVEFNLGTKVMDAQADVRAKIDAHPAGPAEGHRPAGDLAVEPERAADHRRCRCGATAGRCATSPASLTRW